MSHEKFVVPDLIKNSVNTLIANTLKQAAESLEGMKILELCEDEDTDLYEREVGYNQALTDAQKVLLGELDI
jgi:hypothetical protein